MTKRMTVVWEPKFSPTSRDCKELYSIFQANPDLKCSVEKRPAHLKIGEPCRYGLGLNLNQRLSEPKSRVADYRWSALVVFGQFLLRKEPMRCYRLCEYRFSDSLVTFLTVQSTS